MPPKLRKCWLKSQQRQSTNFRKGPPKTNTKKYIANGLKTIGPKFKANICVMVKEDFDSNNSANNNNQIIKKEDKGNNMGKILSIALDVI